MAPSHSTQTTFIFLVVFDHFVVLSFAFCRSRFRLVVLPFLICHFVESKFILYYNLFHRYSILCFVVSSLDFVVFLLSLIRERRGAHLFALNEESAAKVIAADSHQLTVF